MQDGSNREQSTKHKVLSSKSRAYTDNISMTVLKELLFPLIAVLAAFIVGGILILLVGDNPLHTYGLLFGSALSWPVVVGYTLFYLPVWLSRWRSVAAF